MRGNLEPQRPHRALDGSIPACAGEPEIIDSQSPRGKVYPRACGGTEARLGIPTASQGLSPRVRGNLAPTQVLGVFCGSIPARAGEPMLARCTFVLSGVYPRACGGTLGGSL